MKLFCFALIALCAVQFGASSPLPFFGAVKNIFNKVEDAVEDGVKVASGLFGKVLGKTRLGLGRGINRVNTAVDKIGKPNLAVLVRVPELQKNDAILTAAVEQSISLNNGAPNVDYGNELVSEVVNNAISAQVGVLNAVQAANKANKLEADLALAKGDNEIVEGLKSASTTLELAKDNLEVDIAFSEDLPSASADPMNDASISLIAAEASADEILEVAIDTAENMKIAADVNIEKREELVETAKEAAEAKVDVALEIISEIADPALAEAAAVLIDNQERIEELVIDGQNQAKETEAQLNQKIDTDEAHADLVKVNIHDSIEESLKQQEIAIATADLDAADEADNAELVPEIKEDAPEAAAEESVDEVAAEESVDEVAAEESIDEVAAEESIDEVAAEESVSEVAAEEPALEVSAELSAVSEVDAEKPALEVTAELSAAKDTAEESVSEVAAEKPALEVTAELSAVSEVDAEKPALEVAVEESAPVAAVEEVAASPEASITIAVAKDAESVATAEEAAAGAETAAAPVTIQIAAPSQDASAGITIAVKAAGEEKSTADATVEAAGEVAAAVEAAPAAAATVSIAI